MAICILDETGYCARHRRVHEDAEKKWALSDTEKGEAWRTIWDRQLRGGGSMTPQQEARGAAIAANFRPRRRCCRG